MIKIFDIFKSDVKEHDIHAYNTKMEDTVRRMSSPFEDFINSQGIACLLLCLCTIVAIILATLPETRIFYKNLIHTDFGFIFSELSWSKNLKFWVNDFLLTIFFFVIGLEIKREFLVGELNNIRRSGLVVFGAIGGMVVPALIYTLFNYGTEYSAGFGIPVATDTAFAVGLLSLFRKKLPKGVFSFITALAIIDDIGAITIIAIFYTKSFEAFYLMLALIMTIVLCIVNLCGARRPFIYIAIGFLVWFFIEHAGVHGTIAGIMVAFTIPARPRKGPKSYIDNVKNLISYFEERKEETPLILEDTKQHNIVEEIKEVSIDATTPLQRWENRLELPIAIFVLPIFAFFNAGIELNFDYIMQTITSNIGIGIILGLLIGKPLGIFLFVAAAINYSKLELPDNTTLSNVLAMSFFCGIGFTMSIFIADINYTGYSLELSKMAVILSSFMSFIFGATLVYYLNYNKK